MKKPKLDPVTLRWLADDEDTQCRPWERDVKNPPEWATPDQVQRWADEVRRRKNRARWLRNLATRAEKQRGGR
jgi:hypothetical protein